MQPKQKGIVHFDSEPRGAQIIVDGQLLIDPNTEESLRTPATVSLYEGRRDFILRLEGSNDTTGYVDIYPGTTVNIFRNFSPGTPGGGEKPEPQIWLSHETGAIKVYSFPDGANIYIDDNPVRDPSGQIAKAPVVITDVPAGARRVTFRMPGYMEESKIVDVEPNAWSDVYATMRSEFPKFP